MSSHREGTVNPYRPYYIPPSIGEPSDGPVSGLGPNPFRGGGSNATVAGAPKYASKAHALFSDIDYKEYISEPSPSAVQTIKDLLDESLWKYLSVLMAQPFEVSKTILQVKVQDGSAATPAQTPVEDAKLKRAPSIYDPLPDSDSEGDEPSYFTSNVPSTPTPRPYRQRATPPLDSPQKGPSRTPSSLSATVGTTQLMIRKPDSILEVMSQLWQKEGTWGVWKASNITFVYAALQSLLENWSRSLLSALFNVPDLGVRDDVERLIDIASPYPWASFLVAAGAAVATGLILAPVDLVRTRLILTSVSRQPRRSISMLRSLPSYICPSPLIIPTILHSLVHPVLTLSTPLMLRTRFGIDREVSPTSFSLSKFCASTVALFVKLPLETVLRRGQASVLSSPEYIQAIEPTKAKGIIGTSSAGLESIIPCGKYDGVLGTMRHIVYHEGTRPVPMAAPPPKSKASSKKGKTPKLVETTFVKGQGMEGLWRGWKVSWWGLVGLWTAGVVGGGGDGEF
ncbi:hypothetical protein MGG_16725 [Pyricularia oryzae 70-15]|uniref:Mitochondrial fusion and transport protein Ugo1 n=3 Tax=Pyricularia oryzae TaxID=318829 RepID=G4N4D0_PYRO7|nr:uncharacterized protein MGG_16725 [Pyricularia oryzae 70-15]EHA51998.1 hypothetical protein MGG_16725 [Pyricularia oryzae 70-15]ELQ33152.1 mitochondrial fusion and transport protein Ugo1 [Pyricularia oryzae Y34]KAI7927549.1 hypothetical protein M0657_003127 [Pyricularia oryzae]KAI7928195.1 hypothetical protein M9X92_001883 [Pyricularia oryzae]